MRFWCGQKYFHALFISEVTVYGLSQYSTRENIDRHGHVPGETNNNAADDDHQERPAYPYDKETTHEMSSSMRLLRTRQLRSSLELAIRLSQRTEPQKCRPKERNAADKRLPLPSRNSRISLSMRFGKQHNGHWTTKTHWIAASLRRSNRRRSIWHDHCSHPVGDCVLLHRP